MSRSNFGTKNMAKSRSRSGRSLSKSTRKRLSDLAKNRPRRADGRFKKSGGRSRSVSKKASRSLSAKTRRRLSDLAKKRPRRADGRFKKSPKRSTSRKSKSTRSRKARFTNEDYRELFRIFGIRNSKYAKERLHEQFKDAYLEAILDGYVVPQISPAVTFQVSALGFREPTLSSVLDHFYHTAPERLGCTKEVCVKSLEKFEMIGILPKSPEDVKLIIVNTPSEQKSLNARCWVCLYKSYREVFFQLNGRYPAADIDFDFVDRLVGAVTDEVSGSKSEADAEAYFADQAARLQERRQKIANLAAASPLLAIPAPPTPPSISPSSSLMSF